MRGATSRRPAPRVLLVAAGLLLAVAGCRQDMHDGAKVEPLEASRLYADGAASRPLVEGTVARGTLREDTAHFTGIRPDGRMIAEVPVGVDRDLLLWGRSRYQAFCSPCHGATGGGRGMIVRRGFKQPSSFHIPRLRQAQAGYFYDVITNGFGQMSSYAPQLTPDDRWAVVAYVRALQVSQHARLAELPAAVADDLAERIGAAAGEPGSGEAAE